MEFMFSYLVESTCKVLRSVLMSDIPIRGMILEELCFTVQGIFQTLSHVDVGLTTIDDPNESQLQRIDTTCEYIESVGASIHEIQLCQDTDCPSALGIH